MGLRRFKTQGARPYLGCHVLVQTATIYWRASQSFFEHVVSESVAESFLGSVTNG